MSRLLFIVSLFAIISTAYFWAADDIQAVMAALEAARAQF